DPHTDLVVSRNAMADPDVTVSRNAVASQDDPVTLDPIHPASAAGPGRSIGPELVVARHMAPDEYGVLPPAESSATATAPGSRLPMPVQRSLLALRPTPLSSAGTPNTPIGPPTLTEPAGVQRIQYGDVEHPVSTTTSSPGIATHPAAVDVPVEGGTAAEPGFADGLETGAPAITTMPTAPASAAWSPVPTPTPAPTKASTPGSPPSIQRSGPLASPGASPATLQRVFDPPVAVSRSTSAAPVQTGSAAQSLAPAQAAETPTMAVSSRTVGLAELFSMAAAQPATEGATVQRLATGQTSGAAEPSVQTAVETTAPQGTAVATPGQAPDAPAAPPTAEQLEEMARRLYEPMASRIRAELWQDRERAGLLTDLRP
ncbi:MAG: hypothetical protein QM650_05265, partial [Microlunatus sp.]